MNATENHTSVDPIDQPPSGEPVGHQGARVDVGERRAWVIDGFAALAVVLVLVGLLVWLIPQQISETEAASPGRAWVIAGLILLIILIASSLVVVSPGTTKVIQFFGRYVGTTRRTGLSMVVPLTTRKTVSIRVHNFETNALKVNDASGNPVDIAAIVVWQVADTARASFSV